MNKSDLVEAMASKADIKKRVAAEALDALLEAILGQLKDGNSVTLVGFGTFYVGERSERMGLNPQTKEPIKIKAARVPKFRAGKALKDACN